MPSDDEPKVIGRPSLYSDELALTICERLADGMSLVEVCRAEGMPHRSTVFRWLEQHPSFRDRYARARDFQAESMFDDILNIADDARNDWMERSEDKGRGWIENGESLRRSQLRVEARKWCAAKLTPRKYGDKIEVTGKITADVARMTDEELAEYIARRTGSAGVIAPPQDTSVAD